MTYCATRQSCESENGGGDAEVASGHPGQELAEGPAAEAAQAAHGGGGQQQGGGGGPGGRAALRHRLHRPLLPLHYPGRLSNLSGGCLAPSSDLLKAGKSWKQLDETKRFSTFVRHRSEKGL